ncbi:MAG: efflux RND transporter permease subunit [Rikenellaceae bacterium]|nr:efflux RND transporter permease subunit [Rikenellaceae bacterium]
MNLKFFIDRPIFSAVISIVIVFLGVIGLFTLPVEQYPDIAPPTISVTAQYTGANSATIQNSVIAPLEEAINGVENMTYMTSSATNTGQATINVYFKQGTDPDMAAVNVQNRVSKATGSLPSEVTRIGVTTSKRQNSILKMFSLYSPDESYDNSFLSNYIQINIEPRMMRITGVGEMRTLGSDYSMRIWMKPDVMAQYGLVPDDITYALAEQNLESATGSFGENYENTFQYTMIYRGRLVTAEEFGNIVLRALPDGEILRLKDVADVELGDQSYAFSGNTNGKPGVTCLVFQTAGTNATAVIGEIDALLEDISKDLPPGIGIVELQSANDFLFASFREVAKSLLLAIILVVIVVYVFLQDFRATFIPMISIIVSLLGTFGFMAVAGFSINLLTLFALVLAIGTVVDNAIIVVEAVQARFEVGYKSSYMATNDAMKGISPAIISSTIVFMAVFIPVSMMGGTSGKFYTQFGITMAVAVGLSALNALTLSPALCAILMKPYITQDGKEIQNFSARFRKVFNTSFHALIQRYQHAVLVFIKRPWLTWLIVIGCIATLVILMNNTKTGLVPNEDQGVIFVDITTAPGSSVHQTDLIIDQIEERLKDIPQLANYSRVTGFGLTSGQGSSYGLFMIKLKPWSERTKKEDYVDEIIKDIYMRTADVKDARLFAMAPAMIPGYGTSNGFELHVQDRRGGDVVTLYEYTQTFLGALNQRPEISSAFSSFNPNYPQWRVEVDAAKAKRAGLSPSDILSTLAGYYGGQYVSDFNRFSKIYYVMLQADPAYRLDPESLDKVFVRGANGDMAPLSQFVTLTKMYGSELLNRFNMYQSIAVNGVAADGYSSGDAIRAIAEVAAETLPQGYGYEYGGITREESQSSNSTVIIFAICTLMIYLILSAMYESFLIPLAVIISVPCGLMGSFLFAKIMSLDNDIYLQTGLIMLIGLLAKTAILLTEYASERRRSGMGLTQSAVAAAKARLRPILMTALTMVFGMLPLVFSTGVGANGNSSLGTGAVGGMIVGTLALLFLVPSLFIIFQFIEERFKPIQFERSRDWAIQAELEEETKK